MTKSEIAQKIKETEEKLAELREQLLQPKKIVDFKVGDVYNCPQNVPLIVMETWGEKYFVAGCGYGGRRYLNPYSDIEEPVSKEEMLDYLNQKVESGWKLIGNISDSFDEIVKKMIDGE